MYISRSLLSVVACFLLSVETSLQAPNNKDPGLYKPGDNVDILDVDNFKESIYNIDQGVFLEFYSHWCGACQRYSKHWKEIASYTKRWHSSVIRVAAINCADTKNSDLCNSFDIRYYPTLKVLPARAKFDNANHDATLLKRDENDLLINEVVGFIEKSADRPSNWPELKFYNGGDFDQLFKENKYALLVVESEDSLLGRNLILDFAARQNLLPIRRITKESSPALFQKLGHQGSQPAVFLVQNNAPAVTFELFNEDFVTKFLQLHPAKIEVTTEEPRDPSDARRRNQVLVDKFLASLDSGISSLKKDPLEKNLPNPPNVIIEDDEKGPDVYLTSTDNRVFMQDLESGLSLLLRSDIATKKFISGDKLEALKEILRVLVEYFPGREPVRNYIMRLYESVKTKSEITAQQWKELTDYQDERASLPHKIEWRHCKGSTPNFRGYPCSLWTIFHVLTVSQVEQEKAKQKPFQADYNVKEVVNAMRLFVINFFTCKECSQNFYRETEGWESELVEPYSAVKYVWKVHNKVNIRLKNEDKDSTLSDPAFPKGLFPSKAQCAHCLASNGEEKFVETEVVKFLMSFYSKFQIEGVLELEIKKNMDAELPSDLRTLQDRLPIKELNQKAFNEKAFVDETSRSMYFNLTIFLLLMSALGILFVFYGFRVGQQRVKAHIV